MAADKQLYVTLNTGAKMPLMAFGTLMETITPDQGYVSRVVTDALDTGYRHLDTARIYGNEQGVGAALRAAITSGKIKREDVFVTTKLWRNSFSPEDVVPALKHQLSDLDLQYVDLYLVHWPTAFKSGKELIHQDEDGNQIIAAIDCLDTWKGMEQCYELGLTKAIGLSNFNSVQLQRVLDNCKIKPANLQIESHPYLTNSKLVRYCKERGVTVTAYSPLGGPSKESQPSIFSDPTIAEIAQRHNATAAQVALRFQLQRNVCVAPKSSKKHRMEENFKALDFELTEGDMETLEKCNRDFRLNAELKHYPFYPFNIEF